MRLSKFKLISDYLIVLLGIIIAMIYWVTETLIHFFIISPNEQFISLLLTPNLHELWMRTNAILFIILFSSFSNVLYILDKRKEKKIIHISSILKAIRNVNQVIVKVKSKRKLLNKVCKGLIETRGFLSAWIALFDKEKNVLLTSEAGIGDEFTLLKNDLESKKFCNCYFRAIVGSGPKIIKNPKKFCKECPINHTYGKRGVITCPLIYEKDFYGIITVSTHRDLIEIKEEKDLFEEVSKDIAFALYNINLEQAKKQTDKKLKNALKRSDFYKDLLAHDMGNILNNLKNSIQLMELLSKNPNKEENILELKEIVKKQIERGSDLINNIRKLSKIEEGREKLTIVELPSIIGKAIESVKIHENPVNFYPNIPQGDYNVMGGELLIDAFENIILNAIIHNKSKDKKVWINVSDFERGGVPYIRIEFKDNGIGIADESKQIIFTKTYKKEKATVGMGIGLSLVNEIISEYGGEIWAENRVKDDYTQGTNLILLLKKA